MTEYRGALFTSDFVELYVSKIRRFLRQGSGCLGLPRSLATAATIANHRGRRRRRGFGDEGLRQILRRIK